MQKISLQKQTAVVRWYLSGLAYSDIVKKTGVSKGTVANIVADLRAGHILEVTDAAEQLDLLRELAVDLYHLKLSPGQAIAGISVMSLLQKLGIEPAEIQTWAGIYHQLAASEDEREAFLGAAQYLQQLRESTGLTLEQLNAKAHTLKEEITHLQPLADELYALQQQAPDLEGQRKGLSAQLADLEKQREKLLKEVAHKEKRETVLTQRVQKLEKKEHDADKHLAAARKDLEQLAELGMSFEDLRGFTSRIAAIAHKHGLDPTDIGAELLHGLEIADTLTDFAQQLDDKALEFAKGEQALESMRNKHKAETKAVQNLQQRRAKLQALLAQEEVNVREAMQSIISAARQSTTELRQGLETSARQAVAEVHNLKEEALALGRELGWTTATLEANQWLHAVVSLVRGDGQVSTEEAQTVALPFLRGLRSLVHKNPGQYQQSYLLGLHLDNLIQELERWRA